MASADTTGRRSVTRRQFLQAVAAASGSAAMMNSMAAIGQIPESDYIEPPALDGSGEGTSVVILGAGTGGCVAAYELMQLGYDVTVLEAEDRLGGHAFTVRGGSRIYEYGNGEQVCDWDDGVWFDAGPSRIPFFHRGILHYCRELNIPLIDHKNVSLSNYVYMEGIDSQFDGQRMRLNEFQTDMGGFTSQLLSQAIDQGALDEELTEEDQERLINYLVSWGLLSSDDLTYTGGTKRGFEVLPDVDGSGEFEGPPALSDLLPYAEAALQSQSGYLGATQSITWQSTMMKPKEGWGQIYNQGFADALGDRVQLNSEVQEIRQSDDGVTIVVRDTETDEEREVTADYCMCNIPLSVLIQIPGDFSSEMTEAMQAIPYQMSGRGGAQFNRRFWEEDDWIYGGQAFTNIPEIGIMDYPDDDYHAEKGAMLVYYSSGNIASTVGAMSYEERMELALEEGSKIHPQMRDEYHSGFSVAWHLYPYTMGAWPTFPGETRQQYFPTLQEPDGRIYLVGEHVSYLNAWAEGAIQGAWMQLEALHSRVMQED